jgi:RNA polymerase sigma factor (sigma-70 family)
MNTFTEEQKIKMLKSVEGIVKTLAKKYTGVLTMDELIQAGNTGVLQAIDRWDEKITKFSTFAFHYARGFMQKAISIHQKLAFVYAGDSYNTVEYNSSFDDLNKDEFWEDILKRLSEMEKKVITLYYREGMNTREICKQFNVSHETIRTIRDNALKFIWLRERDNRDE